MLKFFIFVILVNVLATKRTQAKEDTIEFKEGFETETTFDDAIGNCASRPIRKSKIFSAKPEVSQMSFKNSDKLYLIE
jgi:hypothetical protein